jgi:hypothetical protein
MTFDELQLIVQSIAISQRETQVIQQETQLIVQSIARSVQAMQEQALADDFKRDEEKVLTAQRMQRLEDISAGLIRLYGSLDEDRPTVFRALNSIDRKVDSILDRLPPTS